MSLQSYCDICEEEISRETRGDRNYVDVVVDIKRYKRHLHVCNSCADTFIGIFRERTKTELTKLVKDNLQLPAAEEARMRRWFG